MRKFISHSAQTHQGPSKIDFAPPRGKLPRFKFSIAAKIANKVMWVVGFSWDNTGWFWRGPVYSSVGSFNTIPTLAFAQHTSHEIQTFIPTQESSVLGSAFTPVLFLFHLSARNFSLSFLTSYFRLCAIISIRMLSLFSRTASNSNTSFLQNNLTIWYHALPCASLSKYSATDLAFRSS